MAARRCQFRATFAMTSVCSLQIIKLYRSPKAPTSFSMEQFNEIRKLMGGNRHNPIRDFQSQSRAYRFIFLFLSKPISALLEHILGKRF